MSAVERRVAMPGDVAKIKVGYTVWYRQRYKVHDAKFPVLRDRMLVTLLNAESLSDRGRKTLGLFWSVLSSGGVFAVIPARFLELVKENSI